MITYGYFAVKDRDALRTETYSLTKLAIEQHLTGEDEAGMELVDPVAAIKTTGRKSRAKTAITPDEAKPKKSPPVPDKMLEGPEQ